MRAINIKPKSQLQYHTELLQILIACDSSDKITRDYDQNIKHLAQCWWICKAQYIGDWLISKSLLQKSIYPECTECVAVHDSTWLIEVLVMSVYIFCLRIIIFVITFFFFFFISMYDFFLNSNCLCKMTLTWLVFTFISLYIFFLFPFFPSFPTLFLLS